MRWIGFALGMMVPGVFAAALQISLGGQMELMRSFELRSDRGDVVPQPGPGRVNMRPDGPSHMLRIDLDSRQFQFAVRNSNIFGETYWETSWKSGSRQGAVTGVLKSETLWEGPVQKKRRDCRVRVGSGKYSSYRDGTQEIAYRERLQKKYWQIAFKSERVLLGQFVSDSYEDNSPHQLSEGECEWSWWQF